MKFYGTMILAMAFWLSIFRIGYAGMDDKVERPVTDKPPGLILLR